MGGERELVAHVFMFYGCCKEYCKPSGLKQQKLCAVHWCLAMVRLETEMHTDLGGCLSPKGGPFSSCTKACRGSVGEVYGVLLSWNSVLFYQGQSQG